MTEFSIKRSLKDHYLFEYPIKQLIETFVLLFKQEKQELVRQFENRLEPIYGEQNFSSTVFNISDIIVFKYFNDRLTFADKAFIRCEKFKEYPFSNKINDLEEGQHHDRRKRNKGV